MAKKKKEKKSLPPWLKNDDDKSENDDDKSEKDGDKSEKGGDKKKKGKKSLPPWLKKDGDDGESVKENHNIHRFIKSIIEKNYAEANKYLQGTFEDKLAQRIRKSAKGKLF